ncbi:Aminotransferase class IV like protein [Aduncisulcus paluster]|uniref:Aminotransferase class IV like protein n=1 Tax=Aduncisulcus paluster TaxID=2918883 RepID=A0ABQ5KGS0_9EUKA|nr:Aminotransferase class IV like protein [Aduncisulcus paluster]
MQAFDAFPNFSVEYDLKNQLKICCGSSSRTSKQFLADHAESVYTTLIHHGKHGIFLFDKHVIRLHYGVSRKSPPDSFVETFESLRERLLQILSKMAEVFAFKLVTSQRDVDYDAHMTRDEMIVETQKLSVQAKELVKTLNLRYYIVCYPRIFQTLPHKSSSISGSQHRSIFSPNLPDRLSPDSEGSYFHTPLAVYMEMIPPVGMSADPKRYGGGMCGVAVLGSRMGRDSPSIKDAKWVEERKKLSRYFDIQHNVEDIILLNPDDQNSLLEGLSSNIVVLHDNGVIQTADKNILQGTMRTIVLEAAQTLGHRIDLSPPLLSECSSWLCVFVCSTSRIVVPLGVVCVCDIKGHVLKRIKLQPKHRLVSKFIVGVRDALYDVKAGGMMSIDNSEEERILHDRAVTFGLSSPSADGCAEAKESAIIVREDGGGSGFSSAGRKDEDESTHMAGGGDSGVTAKGGSTDGGRAAGMHSEGLVGEGEKDHHIYPSEIVKFTRLEACTFFEDRATRRDERQRRFEERTRKDYGSASRSKKSQQSVGTTGKGTMHGHSEETSQDSNQEEFESDTDSFE